MHEQLNEAARERSYGTPLRNPVNVASASRRCMHGLEAHATFHSEARARRFSAAASISALPATSASTNPTTFSFFSATRSAKSAVPQSPSPDPLCPARHAILQLHDVMPSNPLHHPPCKIFPAARPDPRPTNAPPHHRHPPAPQPPIPNHRTQRPRLIPPRRPKHHRRPPRDVRDNLLRFPNLPPPIFHPASHPKPLMIQGMIPNLMPLRMNPLYQPRHCRRPLPNHKESSPNVFRRQNIQHPRRKPLIRPIIKRERHPLPLRQPPHHRRPKPTPRRKHRIRPKHRHRSHPGPHPKAHKPRHRYRRCIIHPPTIHGCHEFAKAPHSNVVTPMREALFGCASRDNLRGATAF